MHEFNTLGFSYRQIDAFRLYGNTIDDKFDRCDTMTIVIIANDATNQSIHDPLFRYAKDRLFPAEPSGIQR